jgi:hypothetical protein
MHVLLSKNNITDHITKSVKNIKRKIDDFLQKRFGWHLTKIDTISIKVYTYCCVEGGLYISTFKAFANKKCTINLNNKGLINLGISIPFEECLQEALSAYFAYQDGYIQKLE